jgi:hypothetical protein
MSFSPTVSTEKGTTRRNSNTATKIPEVAKLTLKNPQVFSSVLRARKTHRDKADSSLTYWLPLSELEVLRLRLRAGDRLSVAIIGVERAEEEEAEIAKSSDPIEKLEASAS